MSVLPLAHQGGNRGECGAQSLSRRTFLKAAATGLLATVAVEHAKARDTSALPTPVARVPRTPFSAPAGAWTLVVLPDTQFYSQLHPEVFHRQTEWIAAHQRTHDIRFVAHEGDITQRNTDVEWQNAQAAMRVLNQAGIPYAVLPGNHDLGRDQPPTARDRYTLLNEYFRPADYGHSRSSGFFEKEKMENSWHEFPTPTGDVLLLALEYAPRHAVLAWANEIVAARPRHLTIVVTHAFLYQDNTRYDWEKRKQEQKWNPRGSGLAKNGDANDGEDIWQKLVSRHPNIHFVLSGHVLEKGTGYLASSGQQGTVVHQILANYQRGCVPDRGYGGGGFLRLMQFSSDHKTVGVRTYSPWYDKWLVGPEHQFDLTLTSARA